MTDKKIFVFDVDGTLAECNDEPIYEENKRALQNLLSNGKSVLIVSAGSSKRILKQLHATGPLKGKICIMGHYGLDCVNVQDGLITKEKQFSYKQEIDENKMDNLLFLFREKHDLLKIAGHSHVINDSGLIVLALLGTEASKEDKKSFDPSGEKRQLLVRDLKQILPKNMRAYVAGQTSIDIIDKKYDKRNAILRYAEENNFAINDILFFGDEITVPFGNDSSLLNSGIDYIEVKNFKELSNFFTQSNLPKNEIQQELA